MTSVRYLSPSPEIRQHRQHHKCPDSRGMETKTLMVALPAHLTRVHRSVTRSEGPAPGQHQPIRGGITLAWPIREQKSGHLFFLWQFEFCSHECLHLDSSSRLPNGHRRSSNEWELCSEWGKDWGLFVFERVCPGDMWDVPISGVPCPLTRAGT